MRHNDRRRRDIIKIRAEINKIEKSKTIERINESRNFFFKKTNKTDKHLARLIKKKKESIHINRIRNQKGNITTDSTEIQKITREYYEKLYANKLDNLDKMDFLEKYNLPRLTQEETENLKRPITSKEIELVTKNYLRTKHLYQMASLLNFIKHLEKN